MVVRSSSSTANFGLAVQRAEKQTVNGRLVPGCDVVMLVHPMPTRGEPAEVIPDSAGSSRTGAVQRSLEFGSGSWKSNLGAGPSRAQWIAPCPVVSMVVV